MFCTNPLELGIYMRKYRNEHVVLNGPHDDDHQINRITYTDAWKYEMYPLCLTGYLNFSLHSLVRYHVQHSNYKVPYFRTSKYYSLYCRILPPVKCMRPNIRALWVLECSRILNCHYVYS